MSSCPSCGNILDSGADFCDECGHELAVANVLGCVVIGANQDCDYPFDHPAISGQHAKVERLSDGQLRVTDLGSTNGTLVNGRRVQQAFIGSHDQVTLGSVHLDIGAVTALMERMSLTPRRAPAAAPAFHAQVRRNDGGGQDEQAPPPRRQAVRPKAYDYNDYEDRVGPRVMAVAPGKIREPALVILLLIFTLGFYGFYWFWVTLDDLRMWRGGQGWSGAMVLMGLVPLVGLIIVAVYFLIPGYLRELYTREGVASPVSGPIGLLILIPFLGPFIWFGLIQSALNRFWRMKGAGEYPT